MQPVWVAMLRGRGRLSINRLVVVPAGEKKYESIARTVAVAPKDAPKPQPVS